MTLNSLSKKELEILQYVDSLEGSIQQLKEQLSDNEIFNQCRDIHKSYLALFHQQTDENNKLETLKRLIFLNWYSLAEPSCYTGIEELDAQVTFESYAILDEYIKQNKLDTELKWMLSYYSCMDFIILMFTENKLNSLTNFVKNVNTSVLHTPKNELPKGSMNNRGQMGIYWISQSVEINS